MEHSNVSKTMIEVLSSVPVHARNKQSSCCLMYGLPTTLNDSLLPFPCDPIIEIVKFYIDFEEHK